MHFKTRVAIMTRQSLLFLSPANLLSTRRTMLARKSRLA